MNTRKQKIKLCAIINLVLILTYIICLWGNQEIGKLVDSLTIQILAILVGLIIGAVGVLIALLGNLFNNIVSSINDNDFIDIEVLKTWIGSCNITIREVKDDVLFLIGALLGCSLLSLLKNVDIPLLAWPFTCLYLKREILINTISLWLLGLSFVAIIDVVKTMFTINDHNEALILNKIDKIKNQKGQ